MSVLIDDRSVSAVPLNPKKFGVYVHWPFCAAKCPYCDFNSHVRRGGIDQKELTKAYLSEIRYTAGLSGARNVSSIFFGGGTPSLMDPETVSTVLEGIAECWTVESSAEITMEANPSSVEATRFAGYRAAGVNRVSLGIQSLNDSALKFLGRLHSAAEARDAVEIAQTHFPRVSIDLIYARPGQTPDAWEEELSQALRLGTGHISLYQLTIEPGTAFFDLEQRGHLRSADEETAALLYELTQSLTGQAGMKAYEISNHALAGEECQHNLIYWRGQDYAGVGPGAHGRLSVGHGRLATATIRHPESWSDQVAKLGHGLEVMEALEPAAVADEALLMGLRLSEGLELNRIEKISGKPIDIGQIEFLESQNLLQRVGNSRIRATAGGKLVLNALVEKLSVS